jgi:hypothetical protein
MKFRKFRKLFIVAPANSFRISFGILSQRISTIEIYWCALTKKGWIYTVRSNWEQSVSATSLIWAASSLPGVAITTKGVFSLRFLTSGDSLATKAFWMAGRRKANVLPVYIEK